MNRSVTSTAVERPHRLRPGLLTGGIASLPLLITAVVLLWRPWVPVLDMVMTELRLRDVAGRHTPLVGLPGRIGTFPDQGSHPGPASFYLLAPFYWLSGSRAWGMQLGSVVINTAAVVGVAMMGARRFGHVGAVMTALLMAVAVRGYGLDVLTHPWNPYFPLLIWAAVLIATWLVLIGEEWLLLVVVVGGSIAAQTHVPYLSLAIALNVLGFGALLWQLVTERRYGEAGPVRPLQWAFGIGVALWTPPLYEQLTRDDGNVSKLVRHFATDQPDEAIGLGSAFRLVSQHFDLVSIAVDLVGRDDAFVHRADQSGSTSAVGVIVLATWLVAIGYAVHRRERELVALHAVAALSIVVGWFSISRIFGKVWFYLSLWMSTSVLLVCVALAWTGWLLLSPRSEVALARIRLRVLGFAVLAVSFLSGLAIIDHEVPEVGLSEDVRVVMPDVAEALTSGIGSAPGRDGRYLVVWEESVIPGSQGFALLNELERRGFDVGVDERWRVPATPHRVLGPGEADAEVHLATGAWIDEWRARPGFVEIVEYDDRSAAERARFATLERRVIDRLEQLGRDDLRPFIDRNLFAASLDPDLPQDVIDDLSEMLLLGEPVAVFVAPAGTSL